MSPAGRGGRGGRGRGRGQGRGQGRGRGRKVKVVEGPKPDKLAPSYRPMGSQLTVEEVSSSGLTAGMCCLYRAP